MAVHIFPVVMLGYLFSKCCLEIGEYKTFKEAIYYEIVCLLARISMFYTVDTLICR